ncbi:MAG: hypothetical protein CMP77_14235 [Flavobacterium sp.]|nr:hypothetical protein [Pseudozobellia sp.]MBF01116.1 hypothetical protein [Flavobacterium sp.]MBG49047.1 hypothetical protein [Pseudozobellia sp.]|tara:strand:- start:15523 stop:15726 length:204 start_codon:yes stop_codon:yes gene_type:complete
MNKVVTIILLVMAVALMAYNATMIDFENPLKDDSSVAVIGIIAPLCAILLILIYRTSKKIQEKVKGH